MWKKVLKYTPFSKSWPFLHFFLLSNNPASGKDTCSLKTSRVCWCVCSRNQRPLFIFKLFEQLLYVLYFVYSIFSFLFYFRIKPNMYPFFFAFESRDCTFSLLCNFLPILFKKKFLPWEASLWSHSLIDYSALQRHGHRSI
jgi:hypothetical protein